ncbi:MAG: thymidine phosphorylase [Polyangia bacterium]|jgi:pyrimidine-nucleoside phosphorylase|nr:thymidine phosphorylase [Polyangia bacterium]
MRVQDIIATKRDGGRLSKEQIRAFIQGYTGGSIPDYQAAALLMAILWRGMEPEELSAWTDAMLHSGIVVDLSDLPGVKVDKHSTGGVGDKISLCLAPAVAACGVPVPMISGRGLGHTGGTLDKLEAIPGFAVNQPVERFRELLVEHGFALIGQTADIVPADRKLYALRDVTATVPSIPLIASSIMSKKLAEGMDALVLDVKVGAGAFMRTVEDARALARTLIGIGLGAGKQVTAVLTRMEEPLGNAVGNANETIESIEVLKGRGPADVTALTYALGSEMLVLGGKAATVEEARTLLGQAIVSGRALAAMKGLVRAQGGDPEALEDYGRFPAARSSADVTAPCAGVVQSIDAAEVGIAGMLLGAGRRVAADPVDHGVGVTVHRHVGDQVAAGEPLATLLYNDPAHLDEARRRLAAAYRLCDDPVESEPLVIEVLRGKSPA